MEGIPRSELPASHMWTRRLVLVGAGVLVFMLAAWVNSDPVENLSTDWTAFDNAADRVVAGETVYRPYDGTTEPLPYLYPPFALWLSLPLAAFGFAGSFLLSALLTITCLVLGLRWMSRVESGRIDRTTALMVCLASGAAVSSTLIGQYSGIYALAIGGAAYAFSRDRHDLAGLALAALWLKPNLAIAVPVVLVWSHSWRMLRFFGLGTVLLVLASLPFGLDQWTGFASNAQMMAELQEDGVVPFRKMITILGSAQTVFDLDSTSPAALAVWLVSATVLGLAVLQLWSRKSLAESPVRAFGGLALFVVAANPRLYFYDSTLVVVGGLGLWVSSHVVGGTLARKYLPVLAVITWFFLWGGLFVSLNRVVGPLAALMLLVSAADNRVVHAATAPSAVGVGRSGLLTPLQGGDGVDGVDAVESVSRPEAA